MQKKQHQNQQLQSQIHVFKIQKSKQFQIHVFKIQKLKHSYQSRFISTKKVDVFIQKQFVVRHFLFQYNFDEHTNVQFKFNFN